MASTGIVLANDGIVQGVHANSNGGDGIDCRLNCLISGNTINNNHNVGIQSNGSKISANTQRLSEMSEKKAPIKSCCPFPSAV
jgi:hypothetical protein